MKFTAVFVEAVTNSVTANVLFADPETDPDQPFILSFSRAVEFEDSAYYFEINDQTYGSYQGLKSIRLTRGNLTVEVEPAVIEKFGEPDFAIIEVDFETDNETYQQILDGMQTIFNGFDEFSVE